MNEAKHPVRVLRIIARLNIGGPAMHAILLTEQLRGPEYESLLVAGRSESDEGDVSDLLSHAARRFCVPSLRQPLGLHDIVAWWRIFRIVWREQPDIVHTHTAKAGALGRSAVVVYNRLRRPRTPCRIVHTFHGHVLDGYFPAWQSAVFTAMERWLAKRTDCLIAVSEAIRDQLLQKGIGRPSQWQVIRVGLDLSALARLPMAASNGAAAIRIGMVGRLVPIKNPMLFLTAMARTVQQARPVHGVMVGDGPLRGTLERAVERLGLAQRVRLTGWQRDRCAIYQGLDMACLTSWNEGTPVALIEAMAAGRTVVATQVGGVGGLLGDGASGTTPVPLGGFRVMDRGVLVHPGDAEGLAGALTMLAQDEGLRRRLAEAARSYALEHFTGERLVREIGVLYGQLQRGGDI